MHLISPIELKRNLPLPTDSSSFISESRKTIIDIFEQRDPRTLIIVGPCSIHCIEESLTYAKELKKLADQVKDSCFIVMRAYIEKPRTHGGWKGLVHDPHLNGSHDISSGLNYARSFLLQLAAEGMPAATEFLTPHIAPYIEDLISWGCIGARTSSSQIHRLLASYLPMPVGIKNTIDGNIDAAISGVCVARDPHAFMHICDSGKLKQVQSRGNPYAHVVLRGSLSGSNYDEKSVLSTLSKLRQQELPPRVLIDCSHGNSRGKYFKQKEAFDSALGQIRKGNQQILGMMLESNLFEGKQMITAQLGEMQEGVSITDSCLDFSSVITLISSVSSSRSMSLTQS